MLDSNKIGAIHIFSQDGDYIYEEIEGKRHASKGRLSIVVKDKNASQDDSTYDLAFDWVTSNGELLARGDFFDDAETPKKAVLHGQNTDLLEYLVYEPGDEDPWVFEFELLTNVEVTEDIVKKNSVERLSSREIPLPAKQLKDNFYEYVTAVASNIPLVIDEDGQARVFIKFLNGRTVQIEHFDAVPDEERAEIFYIHWTEHVEIKKYWTSVSSAIIFSTAFAFTFENLDGNDVQLLMRRCPGDGHLADEFCDEILGGMQMELDALLDDEIKLTMERGFERLEKLILQNGSPAKDSLPRSAERFPKPAPTIRRK